MPSNSRGGLSSVQTRPPMQSRTGAPGPAATASGAETASTTPTAAEAPDGVLVEITDRGDHVPRGPAQGAVGQLVEDHRPPRDGPAHAHRLLHRVDGKAELVAQGPHPGRQPAGAGPGQGGVVAGGDRDRGALDADVGPGIAHVEGAGHDRRVGVDLLGLGAQPVDRLAAVLGRRDQGQLDEGGGELLPALDPLHQVLRRPAPDLELVDVGVGPVADEDVAGGRHRPGDVGVVVQGHGQRGFRPSGADPPQQVPLGVLGPLRRHRSVQAQEDAVQGPGVGQPPEQLRPRISS